MATTAIVFGIPTEVYHRTHQTTMSATPSSSRRRKQKKILHIFFVPGNPGTLFFYLRFLEEFAQRLMNDCPSIAALYSTICCHGLGHAQHHLETSSVQLELLKDRSKMHTKCDLNYQIEHTAEFIRSVLSNRTLYEPSDGLYEYDCMMIGHSIGAYILLSILQQSIPLTKRTPYLLLLMPFIAWSRLPYFHRTKLTSFVQLQPYSHQMIVTLIKPLLRMNTQLKRTLIGYITGHDGEMLTAIAEGLTCDRIIENFLTMGSDEIHDVRANEENMLQFLQQLDNTKQYQQPKQHLLLRKRPAMEIVAVYTDNDEWAPMEDAHELSRILTKNTTVLIQPGLTHAFSLTDERMLQMCDVLVEHFGGVVSGKTKAIRSRL